VRFTDETEYFVSEASVYRLLKAHDLIASPAYIVIKAWGWYYLSTVLDDFSRFIVAWKLCATMKAKDVTAARSGVGDLRSRSNDRCSPTAPAVG
jgi:putative transposase